jgi:hypothetical protein
VRALQDPARNICPEANRAKRKMAANVIQYGAQRGNDCAVQLGHGTLHPNILGDSPETSVRCRTK